MLQKDKNETRKKNVLHLSIPFGMLPELVEDLQPVLVFYLSIPFGMLQKHLMYRASRHREHFQSLLGCFLCRSFYWGSFFIKLSIPFGMLQISRVVTEIEAYALSIPFGMLPLGIGKTNVPTVAFNPFWDASEKVPWSVLSSSNCLSIPFGMLQIVLSRDYICPVVFQSLLGCFERLMESTMVELCGNFQSLLGCFKTG